MTKKVFMIGNAHLDPVWIWRWQEGFAETKATFRSVLDRMNEFDDFVFCCAGGQAYRWVEENCPEMFEEIRIRVAEGRWVLVGGWWVQPDCNIPSGETFARHSLFGQRYLLEKFGRISKTGYNVDSFGHNGMIPQIMKKSGMNSYVYMRPSEGEYSISANLYWWESPDGSRVLTYKIPTEYTFRKENWPSLEAYIYEAVKAVNLHQDVDLMCFFGVGNHGGGPTIENINDIHDIQSRREDIELVISSPDEYFEHILNSNPDIPVLRGSQINHAAGCYSALSPIKSFLRKTEAALLRSETIAAMGFALEKLPVPISDMNRAWENVLFNTFHDILGGCCTKEAAQDAYNMFGEALSISARAENSAAQRISWDIDTLGDIDIAEITKDEDKFLTLSSIPGIGTPLVVYNPFSYSLKQKIRLPRKLSGITDCEGNAVLVQNVRGKGVFIFEEVEHATLFCADTPPMGYSVFWLHQNANKYEHKERTTKITETSIENAFVRVEFSSKDGSIEILCDKDGNVYIYGGGFSPVVINDEEYDTWAHGHFVFDDPKGKFGNPEFRIMEDGPLCVTLQVRSFYEKSTLTQLFTLYEDDKDLHVNIRLNWQEPYRQFSMRTLLAAENCRTIYEIPFGFDTATNNAMERPCQRWVDITGDKDNKKIGLSLINSSQYSMSACDNELRMTCVRSPQFADHYGGIRDNAIENSDIGLHEFNFLLLPHVGEPNLFETAKKAQAFQVEPLYVIETFHKGSLPLVCEGIDVTGEVIVSSYKRAQDNNGYIIRLYEPAGKAVHAKINLPNLKKSFCADFAPNEVKSYFCADADDEILEVDFIEMDING